MRNVSELESEDHRQVLMELAFLVAGFVVLTTGRHAFAACETSELTGTTTCFLTAPALPARFVPIGDGSTSSFIWSQVPLNVDEARTRGAVCQRTNTDGTTPTAARTSGSSDYSGSLSYLPGQRLSACTCKGDSHPGPSNDVGRGGPEIDVIEAQVDYHGYGTASQSYQLVRFPSLSFSIYYIYSRCRC